MIAVITAPVFTRVIQKFRFGLTQEVHFNLRLSDLIGTDDETQVRHTHIYDDVNDGRCNLCGRIRITLLAFSGFMLVMILILVGLILCVKRR